MKKIFALAAAFSLSACPGPLFRHLTRESAPPLASNAVEDCPLAFVKAGFCASLEFKHGPSSQNDSDFLLRFWRKGTSAWINPPGDPAVQLWMPSMGHGSSPVKIERLEPGLFAVSSVWFIMPGAWELRVKVDGETAAQKVDVP